MKTADFKCVKEARAAAAHQLEFYNKMMKEKHTMKNENAKKKLFLVDTITTFRHKYVIEAESLIHAYDEVVMRESGDESDSFDEVTQRYLGETITDGREISKKDFKGLLETCKADKDELSSHWLGEQLIRKIDYTR